MISNILPDKEKWIFDDFEKIKLEIREKYNLSNRKLSKAIDIIKGHREFCINIGLELPLKQINTQYLNSYIRIHSEFQHRKHEEGWVSQIEATCKEIMSEIPNEAIICIYTLIELDTHDYFSEAFDPLYGQYKQKMEDEYSSLADYCSHIIVKGTALTNIKKALKKTGQKTLLKECFTETIS